MKSQETHLPNQETLYSFIHEANHQDTLVFIHGNMGSSMHFEALFNDFKDNYNIHAIDLRGFGKSSYHNPIKTIDDLSLDLKRYVKAHQLTNVIFVTHGTGLLPALRFTLDNKRYVKSLIAFSPCPISGLPIRRRRFFGLMPSKGYIHRLDSMKKHVAPMEKNKQKQQRWILKKLVNELFFNLTQPSQTLMDKYIDTIIAQRNLAEFNLAAARFNIFFDDNGVIKGSDEAKLLNLPILFIHGKDDAVMPYQNSYFNKKHVPNAAIYVIEEAGYFAFLDNQKAATSEMKKHLASLKDAS